MSLLDIVMSTKEINNLTPPQQDCYQNPSIFSIKDMASILTANFVRKTFYMANGVCYHYTVTQYQIKWCLTSDGIKIHL